MNKIKVNIVSAEAEIHSGEALMVSCTGALGELGIYPNHTPLLTFLKPGQVRLKQENEKEEVFSISGGILEVQPDIVTVLADTATRADNLDEKAALEAQEQAKKALENRTGELDYSRALAELAEAAAKVQAIQRLRRHK